MTRVMPTQYRVANNWLRFPGIDLSPVQIPFGLGMNRTIVSKTGARVRPQLRVRVDNGTITKMDAFAYSSWRKILPVFRVELNVPDLDCPLIIDTALTDADRNAALAVVGREHYLGIRQSGLILLARIQNPGIRNALWKKVRNNRTAGIANNCDVVGALFLERLFHGNPNGRDAIYRDLGKRMPIQPAPGTMPGFRRKVVRDLRVYWISRVAVDRPFQRLGIGSVLCDAARQVARERMLESGHYVELIRQLPLSRYCDLLMGGSDFLAGHSPTFGKRLPFKLRTPFLSRTPVSMGAEVVPGCKAYYFSRAGRMTLKSM